MSVTYLFNNLVEEKNFNWTAKSAFGLVNEKQRIFTLNHLLKILRIVSRPTRSVLRVLTGYQRPKVMPLSSWKLGWSSWTDPVNFDRMKSWVSWNDGSNADVKRMFESFRHLILYTGDVRNLQFTTPKAWWEGISFDLGWNEILPLLIRKHGCSIVSLVWDIHAFNSVNVYRRRQKRAVHMHPPSNCSTHRGS